MTHRIPPAKLILNPTPAYAFSWQSLRLQAPLAVHFISLRPLRSSFAPLREPFRVSLVKPFIATATLQMVPKAYAAFGTGRGGG